MPELKFRSRPKRPSLCRRTSLLFILLLADELLAQSRTDGRSDDFVRIHSPLIVLEHVRVIDGTGAEPRPDQTIVISNGQINAIGNSGSVEIPDAATPIDFTGYTAIPGLVGMHDHLFYVTTQVNDNYVARDMPFSFPRLFLANGVTTIRTAGSYEPYTDLEIKRAIDQGKMFGPKLT